ncbi:hypothetical protein NECAME_12090 [Necator americanus]|uniref:Arrestin-like N-terminal domain-containing protein n=1 Tax=Necator americanus TaxID=51031 RepID=W2T3L9_NECAM|nr:hypothetical protein NECAME_12090 [Necator americanus]ETN75811.1 hypothetical protein NECAME_12090 [Necator americanus]
MENVRVEVCTDKAVYVPGQSIKGSVFIITPRPVAIDSVRARLYGDITVQFTNKLCCLNGQNRNKIARSCPGKPSLL